MRVYKFLSCKYGLRALRERRLKITQVVELNDPYELLPFDLSDPRLRAGLLKAKEQLGAGKGLVCFSAGWSNPVIWSHYAECHRGLCLGFDVEDIKAWRVEYVEDLLSFGAVDGTTARAMIYSKYSHWRYENEVRMWAYLHEKSGHHYFHTFGEALQLKEIVVGVNSAVTRRRIVELLGHQSQGVAIMKARRAYDEFRMVADEAEFL